MEGRQYHGNTIWQIFRATTVICHLHAHQQKPNPMENPYPGECCTSISYFYMVLTHTCAEEEDFLSLWEGSKVRYVGNLQL